jgi:hypothetical protein
MVLAVARTDQIFEAGARVIVKQIFDAGRGKQREFAVVAMGGANDEDGPVDFGEAARFGGVLTISNWLHGRFLCLSADFSSADRARPD